MEKGDAEQEGCARDEDGDNVNDDRGNSASIIEENLITNICCDSVSSPNNTSELSFSSVNTDQLSSADLEKESRSEILYKNNFTTCNASDSKFNPEHIILSNVDPVDVTTCGSGNYSVPKQNAHYQHNIHNSSVDEDNPVSYGNRIILESDETKKDELDNKDVHESINLNALATVLDENGKKCPITAEHIIDKTDVDILGAISMSQVNENGINSYSHKGKSSTNLVNNNNILPVFTQAPESSCQQQTSSGFTTSDKTKVSFSFPLNNDSNFNFGINDAFSNMPASKNSLQIKSSSVASITPACNTSIGLFERQADIFRSLPKSTIQMCQISDSLTTVKSNTSSIECSGPPFKMPLFGISVAGTSISSSSVQTPHTSQNTDTPKNNGTGCFTPSYFDFKISSKTQNTVENNSDSASFELSACSKNLFPMTVANTAPVQGTSVKTFAPLENNVFSVGTLNSIFPVTSQQSPSFFKSITSTSPLKLPSIKASKLDAVDRTFQSSLSGLSSLNNNQTTMSSSSSLFGECNKTPLFDRTNAKPLFNSSMTFPKAESSQQSVDTSSHSNCFTNTGLSKLETSPNKTSSLAFGCISKQNSIEQFLLEYNTPLKSNRADITGPLLRSNPCSSNTTLSTNEFNFGTSNTEINFSLGNSSVTPNNNLPFIFVGSENGMSKLKPHPRRLYVPARYKSYFNNIPEIPKIPFRVVKDKDFSVENGRIELRYQCITTMPEYSSFSFEELRFHYDKYNIKPLLPTAVPETFTTKNRMINKGTQTSETLRDHLVDIWKALECPVCLEIVMPPIHQCEQGHHVCNGCWRKIASCPLCKRCKMQTRNYVAEVMVEKLPLPCKYRFDGCMKTMQQKEKIAHEDICAFRTYCCLVHDCNKLHSYKDMVVHMKTVHGHLITLNEGSCHPDSWTLTKRNFQKLIHAFEIPYWVFSSCAINQLDKIIIYGCRYDNYHISTQMLNVGASVQGFFYSIEVADIKELRSVSYKGPVFPLHATLNDNQDCLIVPDSLLSTLKRDSLLRVKISIW